MKQERTQVRRPSATSYKAVDAEEAGSTFVDVGYVNAADVGTGKGAAGVPDFAGAFNAAVSTAGTMYKIYKKGKKGEEDAQAHEGTVQGHLEASEDQAALIDEGTKPDQLVEQRSWQYQNAIVKSKDMPEPERAAFMGAYGKAQLGFQHTTDANIVDEAQDTARINIANGATVAMQQTGEIPVSRIKESVSNIVGLTTSAKNKMSSAMLTAKAQELYQNFPAMAQTYNLQSKVIHDNIGMYTEGVDRVAMDLAGFIPSDTKAYKEEFNQLHPTVQKQLTQEAQQEYVKRRMTASQLHHPQDVLTKFQSALRNYKDPDGVRLIDTAQGKALTTTIKTITTNLAMDDAIRKGYPLGMLYNSLNVDQQKAMVTSLSSMAVNNLGQHAQHQNGQADYLRNLIPSMTVEVAKTFSRQVALQIDGKYSEVLASGDSSKMDQSLAGIAPMFKEMYKHPSLFKSMQGKRVTNHMLLYKAGLRNTEILEAEEKMGSIDLDVQFEGNTANLKKKRSQILHSMIGKRVATNKDQALAIADTILKAEIAGVDLKIDDFKGWGAFTTAKAVGGFPIAIPSSGVAHKMEQKNAGSVGLAVAEFLAQHSQAYQHLMSSGLLANAHPVSSIKGDITLMESPSGGGYLIQITDGDKSVSYNMSASDLTKTWGHLQNKKVKSGQHVMLSGEDARIGTTKFKKKREYGRLPKAKREKDAEMKRISKENALKKKEAENKKVTDTINDINGIGGI